MRVGQAYLANIGLADMADDVLGLDWIGFDQLRNGRTVAGLRIMKTTQSTAFIKSYTRCINPEKLKQISVGTLALMPINSHIERHFPVNKMAI
jgi:hypothetical protein